MARSDKPWRMNIPSMEEPSPALPKRDGPRVMNFDAPLPSGNVKRISIPDQTVPPPSDNKGPRRLSIPEALASSKEEVKDAKPRALHIPESSTSEPVKTVDEPRRRITLADASPVATPVVAPARAHTISVPERTGFAEPVRAPKPNTKTDILIAKAQTIEPNIPMHRLRGRIDSILGMSMTDILNWGQQNLTPLMNTSNRGSQISASVLRINASGWLRETLDASCKIPSFMDRFTAKPPSYYEGMLQKVRSELIQFVAELDQMKSEFFREVGDLHADAISMMVCSEEFADSGAKTAADNRARTLLMAHQTAAMLQQTIESTLAQNATFISQIDNLMAVTIPQWKMAYQSK